MGLPTTLCATAKTLAQSGEYANWRAVQTRLIQLGHGVPEVEAFLRPDLVRRQLTAMCVSNRPPSLPLPDERDFPK